MWPFGSTTCFPLQKLDQGASFFGGTPPFLFKGITGLVEEKKHNYKEHLFFFQFPRKTVKTRTTIGVLFGWFASNIEGDSWFRWGSFHVPGKPIYFFKGLCSFTWCCRFPLTHQEASWRPWRGSRGWCSSRRPKPPASAAKPRLGARLATSHMEVPDIDQVPQLGFCSFSIVYFGDSTTNRKQASLILALREALAEVDRGCDSALSAWDIQRG